MAVTTRQALFPVNCSVENDVITGIGHDLFALVDMPNSGSKLASGWLDSGVDE